MLLGQHDTAGISAPLGEDQLRTMTVPYMVQLRYYLIVKVEVWSSGSKGDYCDGNEDRLGRYEQLW